MWIVTCPGQGPRTVGCRPSAYTAKYTSFTDEEDAVWGEEGLCCEYEARSIHCASTGSRYKGLLLLATILFYFLFSSSSQINLLAGPVWFPW
jgi:hypothetical protein